ncbi:hypothetical protein [Paralysiella testudinis]|uniref:Uncharacterized protein n=1 Tax=Paralysiella testudinis TaxID=2809020 RepID=A0A892ZBJ6_9NEIS|nr:hypothetical protein [Paralysiella testudinis]QRQ80645.1 hypothetical protein JQU52_07640 [Paralysiella testudinis]
MSEYLENLFLEFHQAAQKARDADDKYIIIDRVYENIDDLSVFPFADVLNKIVALIEQYPELDYGGPGPFGSFIEEHKISEYSTTLLDSLYRQPSISIVGLLDRAAMENDFQNGNPVPSDLPQKFRECLEHVVSNPKTNESCREFAMTCLQDLRKRTN